MNIANDHRRDGEENDCRKFRSNRMDSFCENQKQSKMDVLAIFRLLLAMFLTSQPNECDEIPHKGP